MIVFPNTREQDVVMAAFMQKHALVKPTSDSRHIGWVDNSNPARARLLGAVCFNTFIGSTCQLHVAMDGGYHFTPREMLATVMDVAFNRFGIKKLLGIVNSRNEKAIRYDRHLGFVEEYRMAGMHDEGGDIVVFSMTKEQCRYLRHEERKAA
jgi:RimJ/RimL family protein N-acetyltransferase